MWMTPAKEQKIEVHTVLCIAKGLKRKNKGMKDLFTDGKKFNLMSTPMK